MQPTSTFLTGSLRGNVTVCVGEPTQTPRLISGRSHTKHPRRFDIRSYRLQTMWQKFCQSRTYLKMEHSGVETVESASHPGREDGLRCDGEPRQLTSSTMEKAPSSGKKNQDVSHSSNSDRKSKSTCETSYSSPDTALAPLAPHVDVLLHAHTRTCACIHTHLARRVDVIRSHTSAWGKLHLNKQINLCRRESGEGTGKKCLAGVAGRVKQARHLTACSRMTPRAENA